MLSPIARPISRLEETSLTLADSSQHTADTQYVIYRGIFKQQWGEGKQQ